MGVAIVLVRYFLPEVGDNKIVQLMSLCVNIGTGVIVYFIGIWIAKVAEVREFVTSLLKRLKVS